MSNGVNSCDLPVDKSVGNVNEITERVIRFVPFSLNSHRDQSALALESGDTFMQQYETD